MPEKIENEISQELENKTSYHFLNDPDLWPSLDLFSRGLIPIETLTKRLLMLKRIAELIAGHE